METLMEQGFGLNVITDITVKDEAFSIMKNPAPITTTIPTQIPFALNFDGVGHTQNVYFHLIFSFMNPNGGGRCVIW